MKDLQEISADLAYIANYAKAIRDEIMDRKKPTAFYVKRMAILADGVQRFLDSNYEEWCNAESRRGNGA